MKIDVQVLRATDREFTIATNGADCAGGEIMRHRL